MSDFSGLVVVVAVAGALAAGATTLSHPRLALGVLFLLASLSRATLETPLGTMRPEMPATAAVAVVLLAGGRFAVLLRLPRSTLAIGLAFGTYLVVLSISSGFVAPGTVQSLRMVAWLAISMLSGIVAYVLMQPRPTETMEPLAFAGALNGAVGIALAIMFLIAGPGFSLGIQDPVSVLPRVYALGWEANLYASFLAMTAFFAFEAARGRWPAAGIGMLALVLIGFPLGVTRGAWVGMAVGAIAYTGVRVAVEGRPRDMPRLGVAAVGLLTIGLIASRFLLPDPVERQGGVVPTPGPGATPTPAFTLVPSHVPATGSPASSPLAPSTPPPAATAAPVASLEPYPDTLAFRLERVPIALEDLRSSPWIGFGAESFGQRHPDRYAGPGPDHIAILAVVVPYEAGIVGAAGLAIGLILLLLALWRFARRSGRKGDWPSVGMAAAFIGAILSVLVAYQLNNAIHLAVNWIVFGAAAALAALDASGATRSAETTSDVLA